MARNAPTAPRRPLITALKISLYVALVGILALGVAVAVAVASLPSYAELTRRSDLGQMIRVRAANGDVLVSLGPSFGQWLRYDEIPPAMRAAMISVEDKRFRSHIGVDPLGVARSIKVRFDVGRWTQGGSTITQQLARNIFLTNSRTFGRKVKEGVLALAIERKFSKDQILELYLNRVYFGGGAYGIDAASRRFYGHSARELSLGEATIIAGLVKAPSQLFADRRRRSRAQPLGRRAEIDGRQRLHQRRRRGERRSGADPPRTDGQAEQRALFHRLGAAPARHVDRRDQRADRRVDHARPGDAGAPPTARSPPTRRAARKARWSRSTAMARCGRWSAGATMSTASTIARPRPSASRDRRSNCSSISPRSKRG